MKSLKLYQLAGIKYLSRDTTPAIYFLGKYLTIQRDSAYGIWAVNEVDIITPFSSPDVDQVPESGCKCTFKNIYIYSCFKDTHFY